jgi:glycosyltransferase involved in cell wall biosynthesis
MKRIIICAAQVPFARGGAEVLVEGLRRQLTARGHAVDVVSLPLRWYPPAQLISSCLAWRMLDLTEANGQRIDIVISTKFPSYAVRHPNKVTWLVHQYRQAYDWYGTPLSELSPAPDDVRLRQSIFDIDRRTLGESKRLFAISRNVAGRLQRYNGLAADVLYPPTLFEDRLQCAGYGDTLLYVGRLDAAKRVDLLLKAMRYAPVGVQCVVAGTGQDQARLQKLASDLGIGSRLRFPGWVDDETLIRLYAECFAVFYVPLDEDYGYATVEAFQSAKPVITAEDAGGVLEFVRDGETGMVGSAEPEALGALIGKLFNDRQLCTRLGEAGREAVRSIRWQTTLDRLLAE